MQKVLILLGAVLVIAGLLWPVLRQFPFGRLPGDITVPLGNGGRLYLPIATSVLVSVVLTILLRLLR